MVLETILANWEAQVRKGLLELCVLNSLEGNRLYGYEIVKRLSQIDGLVIAEGTIYPILSRFRSQGLVEVSIEESSGGPPRKYYQLTQKGARILREMNGAWRRIESGIQTVCKGVEE